MKYIPFVISDQAREYCMNYVSNNTADNTYNGSGLSEFYPKDNKFKTNFDYRYVCLGLMTDGNVVDHIDIDRDSVLIVPLSPITIRQNGKQTTSDAFVLDTTITHGAEASNGHVFIAFDFTDTYDNVTKLFENIEMISIDV